MKGLLRQSANFCKRNASTILTTIGGAGVVATTIMAVKATPSVLGWAPKDEGEYWIDFNHRKTVMDDGLEVYIIEMPFEPTYDFLEY